MRGRAFVALVLIARTQPAHVHVTGSTEELLQVLVFGTHLLAEVSGGRDQFVALQLGVVGLQVGIAERRHAHQTRLDGGSGLRAPVAGDGEPRQSLPGPFGRGGRRPPGAFDGLSAGGAEGASAELLHGLGQHGVPAHCGSGLEGLPALRAAVGAVPPALVVPVIRDAGRAVTVPARDGGGVGGQIQTHGAVKLLLCPHSTAHDLNQKTALQSVLHTLGNWCTGVSSRTGTG